MDEGAGEGDHVGHGGCHVDLPEALVHGLVVEGALELSVFGAAKVADLLADGFARLEVIFLVHEA